MEQLSALVAGMDEFFKIDACGPDPSFSRYLPQTYEQNGVAWLDIFEPGFQQRFNGLMLKGGDAVGTVFCSVFPTPEVLDTFATRAGEGDLLFLHHPLDLECGDPLGDMGRGFLPIPPAQLDRLRTARLSVYACHTPLDVHPEVGTTAAMVKAVAGRVQEQFWPYGGGFAGAVCAIDPLSTQDLVALARYVFGIDYVDFAGRMRQQVTRVAIVAGAGYKVDQMRDAEGKGAQAYLTGEIFDRVDNDYGRRLFTEVQGFARTTEMSLLGVSHAASEYLVMKTQMVRWLKATFAVDAKPIPPSRWWR
jgi:putative NIF3 family GTP cyclohydrolase 1 type 2